MSATSSRGTSVRYAGRVGSSGLSTRRKVSVATWV
jgi:hypothetical protein